MISAEAQCFHYSNKKRIQVNTTLVKKENRQDSDAIHDKVLAERKDFIDAAVVKTMKGKKTLKLSLQTSIFSETILTTMFIPGK